LRRLIDLHRRVHRGTYQAKPSRRVFIPKADGRQRPLGVAAQAVVTTFLVEAGGDSVSFLEGNE
jgi:hypothetical protein